MTGTASAEVRGYALAAVYGRVGDAERAEVVRMWIDAGAVAAAEAQRRVDEVVVVARAPGGALAGVNTAYVAAVPDARGPYYFYRTYLRPAHRGVWGLPTAMLKMALAELSRFAHPQQPLGVAIVAENPKLMRASAMARMRALGLARLGRDARGSDVWCVNFDGSVPAVPPGIGER